MAKIKCKLLPHSIGRHLQQIYTGFFMLYKANLVEIVQIIQKETINDNSIAPHLRDSKHAHLRVIVNDSIKIHYDTHDSWEINERYLTETDYYFKRSFSPNHLQNFGEQRKKIYPLGLNYEIFPNSFDRFGIQRNLVLGEGKIGINQIIMSFNFTDIFKFTPRVNNLWSFPSYRMAPKILFMVKAWDPFDDPDRSIEKIDMRLSVNDNRAKCIKMLRKEFGDDFYGGFIHTEFAVKNFRKFLMPDNIQSSKGNYINLLKHYPICVATSGLHGSIGWKFAEYIAFSKAIVSEKLNYEVPGNLQKGSNYLEFREPEECVENAEKLFCDQKLREYLMTNNSRYYHSYLRPDSLILNTILTALSEQ